MTTTRAPCPQCDRGPRDTALAITTDDRGTVEFCHRCGYTAANNREMAHGKPLPSLVRVYRPWQDIASHLWEKAQPLRGTLAERYLLSRGCILPPEDGDLRFLPASGEYPASMLARITDAVTCEPISLHFTKLDEVGNKIDRRLLSGHRKAGGCIRLWPDDCVTQGLALAEGIESALSAAWIFRPAWAAVDAGNLAAFPVLAGIEALSIFADHDDAGLKAARECGKRWRDAGREVRIRAAESGDANDLVRGAA